MVSVKHVEKQNLRRARLFLLIAVLLVVCFAMTGCDEEGECIEGGEHDYVLVQENAWLLVITEDETYDKAGDQFEPRCGDTGRYFDEYKCSKCGDYVDRANGKTGVKQHELEPWEQTKAATCTSAGVEKRKCSNRFYRAGDNFVCNYSETRTVPALGHDYRDVEAKEPTCTEPGNTEGKKCSRCGHFHSGKVIPALGHDLVQHGAQAVTCTTVGWDAYVTCSRCNYTTYAEKAALGHDWGDAAYTWSADYDECTARRVCKRDSSHYEDVTANATAADFPATCTENAKAVYTATFGDPFATQTVTVTAEGTAAGHDWGEATYTWSEDRGKCTASRVCKRDGNHVETETADVTLQTTGNTCTGGATTYSVTFTNPAFVAQSDTVAFDGVGHSEEIIPGVPATCKKTGLSEGKICSVCGEILVEQKETDKDPNNHEGPFVLGLNADVPSTCTTPGYHTEGICKACGVEVKTELPLDPDNHHGIVFVQAVPATCVSTGLTEGTKCAACGKVLSGLTETPVDPDNHDWDEASYNWQDNGFCTAVRKCKLEGTHVQTITLPINVLSNSATCEQAGTVTYAADFGEPFAPQFKTSDAPALGHDWGEWGDSTATCTEVGTETRTCQRCSATETQNAAALGHTGGMATCTEQAVCTRCNQPYGEALGHDWGAWTQTKAPNCTEPGEQTRTCQRAGCGATEAEEISPVEGAHVAADPVQENAVAGTCQAEGSYDSVTYCAKCGTELSRETINTGKDASNHAGGTYIKYVDKFVGEGKVAYYTFCSGCNAKFEGEGTADASEVPEGSVWYKEDDNDGGEGGGSVGISGEG